MGNLLPLNEIRDLLRYDAETGQFIRLKKTNNRVKVGEVCGFVDIDGYRRVRVGKAVLAHRLAWALMTGDWPDHEIDHVNGDRDDNRWANLRAADRHQNSWNRKALPNATGYTGVCKGSKSNRYEAAITARGKRFHLGTFDTPEEAHAAYMKAADQLHGEYVRAA